MSADILNGKQVAEECKDKLAEIIKKNKLENKITLAVILAGNDPASQIYVKNKTISCQQVGINTEKYLLPEDASVKQIINLIDSLNNNCNIHGILLQLPLPQKITKNLTNHEKDKLSNSILEKINPKKDVDGFHPYNIGRLAQRYPYIRPCTPKGVIKLLNYYNINIRSKKITIVGASNIVGRPLALEALIAGATVTVCHKFTENLKEHCVTADILCSAVGIPNLITKDFIKPNSTIVDIGINRLENGTLCGDVDFSNAINIADYITPVPGGVGPMTVAMLLENTIECYQLQTNNIILPD